MSHLLKEPLLHFLFIGAVLFLVFGLVDPDDGVRESGDRIVVSSGRIEQLANIFQKTWQRPPSENELEGLVDDFILEEIYYRQAVEMGIDRDDMVIRRRMRQKLEFLTDDAATLLEPADDDLAAYLAANQDKFRRDPIYSFQQLFINPEKHGEDLQDYVAAQLEALRAGEEPRGDSRLLPEEHERATARSVDGTFGRGFAAELDGVEIGAWEGPLRSGFGLHLVRLESREPGVVPELSEIRAAVEREWANEKRIEMRARVNERLREQYEIVIEWPEAGE